MGLKCMFRVHLTANAVTVVCGKGVGYNIIKMYYDVL